MNNQISILKRIIFIGILIIAIFTTLTFLSYTLITATDYNFVSEKLDGDVKIAVISDLHENVFIRDKIAERVLSESPDIVLLAGDIINSDSKNTDTLIEITSELSQEVPVFVAWGNHELDYMKANDVDLKSDIENAGGVVLDKSFYDINIGSNKLRIGGMFEYAFAADDFATTNPSHMNKEVYDFLTSFEDTDRYKLMVAHRPDSFIFGYASKTWNIDLVASGHLHGGQVVVPFKGGLWAPDQGFFPEYDFGVFHKDKLWLAITRGLGAHGEIIPRFNNPPEIMMLNLSGNKD